MTEEELERLEQLANAATPGPWSSSGEYHAGKVPGGRPNGETIARFGSWIGKQLQFPNDENAAFAAAARQAVPELIAEVRGLRKQVTGLADRVAIQAELLSQRAQK